MRMEGGGDEPAEPVSLVSSHGLRNVLSTARDLVLPPSNTYRIGGITSGSLRAGTYTATLRVRERQEPAESQRRRARALSADAADSGNARPVGDAAAVDGFASVSFTVNSAPSGGRTSVRPPSGEAGSTLFTVSASSFVDVDAPAGGAPLRYTFWHEPMAGGERVPLAPTSERSVLRRVLLPAGELRLGCTATDADGASADAMVTASAVVAPPTQSPSVLTDAALAAAAARRRSRAAQLLSASIGSLDPARLGATEQSAIVVGARVDVGTLGGRRSARSGLASLVGRMAGVLRDAAVGGLGARGRRRGRSPRFGGAPRQTRARARARA